MATNDRKDKIIYELIDYYKVNEPTACSIYDKADKLFHSLLTLSDWSVLLTCDEQVLSGLLLLLMDSINVDNPNHIVEGLNILTTVLNEFYHYLDKPGRESFDSTRDLFKMLNNTLLALEEDEEIVKHNQQEKMNNIRQNFDEHLNKYRISLSSDDDE